MKLKPCSEQWKPITGFEGRYEISDYGRISGWYMGRLKCKKPHLKKIQKDKDGYDFILLYKEGKPKGFKISRLVLTMFSHDCPEGYEASHIDGNKNNNHISNLCWETKLENEHRKREHGTTLEGEKNYSAKLSDKIVLDIRQRANKHGMQRKLAKEYGVTETCVSQIVKRRTWKHI